MPRKFPLSINIIDLETTCWEDGNDNRPDGQRQNVIEVGICTLNMESPDYAITDKRSILVKPAHSTISEFCTKLTTITQEMVDSEGVSLEAALKILKSDYKSKDRTWISWGDFDRKMMQRDCDNYGLNYYSYFGPRHTNLKNLFSMLNALPYELGMESALERMHLQLEGTHHRGADDAYNIAKIAKRMFSLYKIAEGEWQDSVKRDKDYTQRG